MYLPTYLPPSVGFGVRHAYKFGWLVGCFYCMSIHIWHRNQNFSFFFFCDYKISSNNSFLIIKSIVKNYNFKLCLMIVIIIVDFAVPADHKLKLKESEKRDKFQDLARELKKLSNMKVTVIPIVIDALRTVTKGLVQGLEDLEIRGWVETIQTIALLRSARILRRVLETWEDLQSLKIMWETSCLHWCEKLLK